MATARISSSAPLHLLCSSLCTFSFLRPKVTSLLPGVIQTRTDLSLGLSLESMDALFGAAPRDDEAFEKGRLGAVKNIRGSIEKDITVEQVERDAVPNKG